MDYWDRKRAAFRDRKEEIKKGIKANKECEYEYQNIYNYFTNQEGHSVGGWELMTNKLVGKDYNVEVDNMIQYIRREQKIYQAAEKKRLIEKE